MTSFTNYSIGPYTITRELGRGGMGVVYLGRDTRLDRDVAIKALPEHLAQDPDRLARFEREAKTLAQLSHPNVAGIHGVEEHEGARYLVLEYVEGETLADRLDRGPLPVDEALEIAVQIAAGVEAAHEAGVIHRDLKPGNVIVTPEGKAKVLDFGLARSEESSSSTSVSPTAATITSPAMHSPTMPGVILGTAAYMSPEQARGRKVDKRTDIWSFGVILYEMLTGASPFIGETVGDSIGAVLHKEIDLDRLPATTPSMARHVLQRCLTRDKSLRLRDIGDARIDLLQVGEATAERASRGSSRSTLLIAVAFALGGLIIGSLVRTGAKSTQEPAAVTRLEIDLQRDGVLDLNVGPDFAIDPAGRHLAYILERGGESSLYVRELGQSEARLIASESILEHPFFSPDGQWIGYFTESTLMKVAINGGSPIALASAKGGRSRGGTWAADDTIVFTPDTTSPLMRISGGKVEALTELDATRDERSHRWPAFVPGRSDQIVFTSQTLTQDFDKTTIELLDLRTGQRHRLHESGTYGRITSMGHLLFAHKDTMFACALSPDLTKPEQAPIPIVSELTASIGNGGAQYALSDNGVLIYIVGAEGRGGQTMPTWVGFDGNETPLFPEPTRLFGPAISPDGSRIAFHSGYGDAIVVYELRRALLAPAYPTEYFQRYPVWSPDSSQLVFSGRSDDHFVPSLMTVSVGGEAAPVRLCKGTLQAQIPTDWSSDGKKILFHEPQKETQGDVRVFDFDTGETSTLVSSPTWDTDGQFSPDGSWVLYESEMSGTDEIYLRRFDGTGMRLQVSVGGGTNPRWAPDGSAAYYFVEQRTTAGRSATLMRVALNVAADPPTLSPPETALEIKPPLFTDEYDIDPTGKRILVLKIPGTEGLGTKTRMHFVMNWFEELEQTLSDKGGTR